MNDRYRKNKVPAKGVLHPVFGTYCRSQGFTTKIFGVKDAHIYYEIYLEDPVKKTWALNKVAILVLEPLGHMKEKSHIKTTSLKQGLDFTSALAALGELERECRNNAALYTPLFPDPLFMGFKHYKAFAEREGYVFDKNNQPHARAHPSVLPPGAIFMDEDVQSAVRNLQRPEDAFGNNGAVNKIPNTMFVFDAFNRAADRNDISETLAEGRIIAILDRFASGIETAHDKMMEYCEKYQELGQGGLIADAENALLVAAGAVAQLKAYGVETAEFEKFTSQCQIICHVLHAQGLYDLIRQHKGDFDLNEAAFKDRVTKAVGAYQEIDSSKECVQLLQDMIVHASHPDVPNAIRLFLTNYKYQRSEYAANRNARPKGPGL